MKFGILIITIFLSLIPRFSSAQTLPENGPEKYQAGQTVKILIIPGHDKKYSGAYFRGVSEQEINLKLAEKIKTELMRDPLLDVTITRDQNGYIPVIQEYFDENEKSINRFIDSHKKETAKLKAEEDFDLDAQVPHADAQPMVAYQLYGVNKWAGENDFDLILNIHFNDDTAHASGVVGKFSGFVVYVPDENLPNHKDGDILGAAIGARMNQTFPTSNMPLEAAKADLGGVIQDFHLIALGSNRTLRIPSVLVEYSYIYEPHLVPELFDLSSFVMARATTRGVYDYLNGSQNLKNLLYYWDTKSLVKSKKPTNDVLALQFGLKELGFFPPKGSKNCKFDGLLGPCTNTAIKSFQSAHKLTADGVAGAKTKKALNEIFSTGL